MHRDERRGSGVSEAGQRGEEDAWDHAGEVVALGRRLRDLVQGVRQEEAGAEGVDGGGAARPTTGIYRQHSVRILRPRLFWSNAHCGCHLGWGKKFARASILSC